MAPRERIEPGDLRSTLSTFFLGPHNAWRGLAPKQVRYRCATPRSAPERRPPAQLRLSLQGAAGGSEVAARIHVARAVCRRAEREALEAAEQMDINQLALVYLNRLSDLLFILARTANSGGEEPLWKPGDSS